MNGQIKLLYLQAYESIIARNLLDHLLSVLPGYN